MRVQDSENRDSELGLLLLLLVLQLGLVLRLDNLVQLADRVGAGGIQARLELQRPHVGLDGRYHFIDGSPRIDAGL
jgi:hypothetical protein